jgi:hypothetical protein
MPAAIPRRSRRWIGFFVVLGALAVIAIVVPFVYNLSLQLKPEQLAEARRRWQENRPADYDLECLIKRVEGGVAERDQVCLVQVRAGRVVFIVDEGEVVYLDPEMAVVAGPAVLGVSLQSPANYGVPALFDQIEAVLRQRTTGERRDYTKADFDPGDGHPNHFIHRVPRTKERLEWFVKLRPIQ